MQMFCRILVLLVSLRKSLEVYNKITNVFPITLVKSMFLETYSRIFGKLQYFAKRK